MPRIEAPHAEDLLNHRTECCATCTWGEYYTSRERPDFVICRVRPPALPGGGSVAADWPQPVPDDWCAAYNKAPDETIDARLKLIAEGDEGAVFGSARLRAMPKSRLTPVPGDPGEGAK